MGYLLSRKLGSNLLRFYFGSSIFINIDCNKCGQTSRLVTGAQIQTSCNFEKNVYNCDCFMDFVHRWCLHYFWNSLITSWCQYIGTAICLVTTIFAYTNIFLTLRHNQIHVDHVQSHVFPGQPSQAIPLNIARHRKAVNSALWIQVTLVVCYLPFGIVVALTPQRGMPLSNYLARNFAATIVYLNSSLNPFLYCWKMRQVRQAVKETLRQLYC